MQIKGRKTKILIEFIEILVYKVSIGENKWVIF